MYNINKMPVPNYGTRANYKPIAIVDHITIGSRGSVINTFMRPGGNSSNFLVCRDGEIIEFVPITSRAHTNGIVRSPKSPLVRSMGDVNANYYTATIEHEGYEGHGIDGDLTEEQFRATCWLHKWIQKEVQRLYGNTISLNSHQVIAHNQVDSQKGTCPGTKFPWGRLYTELATADTMTFEQFEERLLYLSGDASKRSVAYAIAERVKELWLRLDDPKWGIAAQMKLEWLYPVIDVVGGEKSPVGVASRVLEIHNTAIGSGKYSPEGVRKLLLFEPLMKERGLL